MLQNHLLRRVPLPTIAEPWLESQRRKRAPVTGARFAAQLP
jgi:hypothetical protein